MNSVPCQCDDDSRAAVIEAARAAGACAAGFTDVVPVPPDHRAHFDSWIAAGRHASMSYMERYGDLRADPSTLLDGAQSMLCTAFAYARRERSQLFADYACGDDYHEVLRRTLDPVAALMRELVPGSLTRICVDTAPLRERYWAARAGIGFIGLNNHLIVPQAGSRVFLAEIIWTARARADASLLQSTCHGCRACIEACPGAALDGIAALDSRRCLSYLTIEHHGPLPDDTRLTGRIYGCDICQDVCPYNNIEPQHILPQFQAREAVMSLDLQAIASMSDDDFAATFRRSAVKRVKAEGLRRNALRSLQQKS